MAARRMGSSEINRWLAIGALTGSAWSCGGPKDRAGTISDNNSAGGSAGTTSSSSSGSGGAGGATLDAVQDPKAPRVEVTSPQTVLDPNESPVLTDNELTVVCAVTRSSNATAQSVDTSSVVVELLNPSGGELLGTAPGIATPGTNEYSATFALTTVPTGPVTIRCSAGDTSEVALFGWHTVDTFVDHGPTLRIASPALDSAHPLEGNVRFQFTADPAPLTDSDPGAEVQGLALVVNGIDIEVPAPTSAGEYDFSVNLADPMLFPDPPAGRVVVLLTASNVRQPIAATGSLNHSFVVDSAGPIIEILEPASNAVIGGEVELRFDVRDPEPGAGIDASTVVVTLGQVDYPYDPNGPWSLTANTFSLRFDSATLQGVASQLTVNVRAEDNVNNESIGQSILLYLDNFPPVLDMDPGNTRSFPLSDADPVCSDSFDPVGNAVNDLAIVGRTALYRSVIWDETNTSSGQTVFYRAKVDTTSARLYVQPDATSALLVDTTGDGLCNEIGNLDALNFVALNPLAGGGNPPLNDSGPVDPPRVGCIPPGQADPLPQTLCNNQSDLHYVVERVGVDRSPVVYGVGALVDPECTGAGWEAGAFASQDGWVCLAARASDQVGNVGVSRPLRVCLDDTDTVGTPDCAVDPANPPSCTDGCTPTPRFNPGLLAR